MLHEKLVASAPFPPIMLPHCMELKPSVKRWVFFIQQTTPQQASRYLSSRA